MKFSSGRKGDTFTHSGDPECLLRLFNYGDAREFQPAGAAHSCRFPAESVRIRILSSPHPLWNCSRQLFDQSGPDYRAEPDQRPSVECLGAPRGRTVSQTTYLNQERCHFTFLLIDKQQRDTTPGPPKPGTPCPGSFSELAASTGVCGAVAPQGRGRSLGGARTGSPGSRGKLRKGSCSARPRRLGNSSARARGSSRMASRTPGFIGGESCSRLGLSSGGGGVARLVSGLAVQLGPHALSQEAVLDRQARPARGRPPSRSVTPKGSAHPQRPAGHGHQLDLRSPGSRCWPRNSGGTGDGGQPRPGLGFRASRPSGPLAVGSPLSA